MMRVRLIWEHYGSVPSGKRFDTEASNALSGEKAGIGLGRERVLFEGYRYRVKPVMAVSI